MRWTRTRSMRDEFGPLPAERWPELATYSDAELMRRPLREVIAEIETLRAMQAPPAKRQTRQAVAA